MPQAQTRPTKFLFAEFALDAQYGTLRHRGDRVKLQDQPLRLLTLLVEHAGQVVTREEIQANLWPENTYVEFDKSLRVAVSKVREALRDPADRPNYIETVPRRGYRFIAPVTPIEAEVPPDAVQTNQVERRKPVATPHLPEAHVASAAVSGRSSRWAWIAVPAALLLAIPLAWMAWHSHKSSSVREVSAHLVLRRSVAVVGLRNLNADANDRWLSTALAEMLSSELSASDSLRVISSEEVARAGLAELPANTPSHETLARYARRLGADMIVYGSFAVTHTQRGTRSGDPLRLDLRVENFSSDAPALVLVKTGQSSNLFDLVTASGSELRQRLGLEALTQQASNEVRKALPVDATAAQFYAEGLNRLHQFDAIGARDLLEKAVKIEPTHAGTHLALSDAWKELGYDAQARAEAERAVELSEGLPRQPSLAMQAKLALRSSDWVHATEIFRSLFTFYPDNVDYGLGLANSQHLSGHLVEALATLQALEKSGVPDVDQARIEILRSTFDLDAGDFAGAVSSAERANQLGRTLDLNLIRAQSLASKASGLAQQSKPQESLAASAEAQTLYKAAGDKRGQGVTLLSIGDVQFDTGRLAEARATFEAALGLFRDVGQKQNMGVTLERLGNASFEQGELPQSRKYYTMALDIYRELHIDEDVPSAIGNIANVQDAEGDIAGAIKSDQQALALFEQTGDQRGSAVTLANMGNLEMERGDLAAAQQDFKSAEETNRKSGYKRGLANALVGQGDVLVAQNDLNGGVRLYQEAFKLVEGSDEPEVLMNVHGSRGFAEFLQRQQHAAISDLTQALGFAEKRGDHANATVILASLARAYAANGNASAAVAAAARAGTESRLQFSPSCNLVASIAHARMELSQGQGAPVRLELQNAVIAAQRYGYLPLAFEARILLARTTGSPGDQKRLLNALADEALRHGWKRLAAEARDA
jgi:DNA-binding winged helix-turn-helix (wHTH) protein/tetratricopeptide (TPR) repeat protein/TolB-like protein